MRQINCILPLRICISGSPENLDKDELSSSITEAVNARLRFSCQQLVAKYGDGIPPASFQRPEVAFPASIFPEAKANLQALINNAIGAAITGHASSQPRTQFTLADYPAREKAVPAKQKHEYIEFEPQTLFADRVYEKSPPFEGALVLQLPGNHYVFVKSHRYAVSDNIAHAEIWGHALFGAEAWVMAKRVEHGTLFYYVASLDEALTSEDAKAQYFETGISGASGGIPGLILPKLGAGDFYVSSVFFRGGGHASPTKEEFVTYVKLTREAAAEGPLSLLASSVRERVFDPIDKLLDAGDDDNLQKAAELLSELDVVAFSTLSTETRFRYLCVLIKAWTWQEEEKAIIEILKSVRSLTELKSLFQQLKDAELWNQLFHDMDDELWSMLATIGEKFGDPAPLTFASFLDLLLEAKLISPLPGVVLNKDGEPEISFDVIEEFEVGAKQLLNFLSSTVKSLWMIIAHPDKLIEGIGQLVKMLIMFDLARVGYQPAQTYVTQVLGAIGKQFFNALKGIAITEMGPMIERIVRYTIIWQVASLFIGVGEIKAAVAGAGLAEKLAAVASLLKLLGILEETAEGEQIAAKLERLAEILSRSSKVLTRDEEILKFLSYLPEQDMKLLTKALGKAELGEGLDLVRLAEKNKELADIATESLRKAEALNEFASKAGGLSKEVADVFGRLAKERTGEEISEILSHVAKDEGGRFVGAIRTIPGDDLAKGGAASTEFLRALGESPQRMNALTNYGYNAFMRLYERAEGNAGALDQYLATLADMEKRLLSEGKAVELRRFIEELERGSSKEWLDLEAARISRFETAAPVEDPASIEKMIEEELAKYPPVETQGAKPLIDPTAPPAARPPAATSFKDALAAVETNNIPPEMLAKLKAGWKKYVASGRKALRSEDEYIRYVWGHKSKQWPEIVSGPRDLGAVGAVEAEAGFVLERAVDAHLPAGSANTRNFPTGYKADCIPDHLPPGNRTIYLNPDGTVSTTGSGTPFSARFVGDSKYRMLVKTEDQTRGFVKLAALSDEKKLVFYVRWREGFPAAETLAKDAFGVGYELPDKFVGDVVQSGIRDLAGESGVKIQLVSDPLWR